MDHVTAPVPDAPQERPTAEWPRSVVFHVPHASRAVPPEVRGHITLSDEALGAELDRLTDHYTDTLFLPPYRADATVTATVSRLVVDVERFLDDANEPMARVGMGAIYTRTSEGRPLKRPLTDDERQRVLAAHYHPHHARLTAAVDRALATYDQALILDLHTFPDQPLPCDQDQDPHRPDICIGTDSFHTPPELVAALKARFTAAGFSVLVDRPYSGTIVPIKHLHQDQRVASVMIEVNRRLYLQRGSAHLTEDAIDIGRRIQARIWRAIVDTRRLDERLDSD